MATVTKTIGSAGDYASLDAWVADLNNGAVYTSGDTAVANIIDLQVDAMSSSLPSTILPTTVKITSDASVRHKGVAGSGSRIVATGNAAAIAAINRPYHLIVDGLEIDYLSKYAPSSAAAIYFSNSAQGGAITISNCILYGFGIAGGSNAYGIYIGGYGNAPCRLENTVICRIRRSSTFGGTYGVYVALSPGNAIVANCVILDAENTNSSTGVGMYCNGSNVEVYNCVSVGNKTADYTGTPSASSSNNASGDLSAVGSSTVTGLVWQNQFRGLIGCDASLKSGSSLINAGVAVSGLTTDCAGNDYSDPPSIGAFEYIPATNQVFHPLGFGG